MNVSSNSTTNRLTTPNKLKPAPSTRMGFSRFWNDLRLAGKLSIGFSILALLALVVGVVSNVGMNKVQKSYKHALNDGAQMRATSLTLSNDLLTARRHEKDFLLRWTEQDFDTQYKTYVVPNQEAVAAMIKDIDALSQYAPTVGETFSDTYPQTQFDSDIATLKASTNTYEQDFQKTVQLMKEKGFKDTGLEGQFRTAVHNIESRIYDRQGLESLVITMLTIRRHEKDYLLRGDQAYIDQLHQSVVQLKQEISASDVLGSSEKAEMLTLSDRYVVAFDSLVEKNIEIAAAIQNFRDAAHTMEPLVAKFQDTGAKMSDLDAATAETIGSQTVLSSVITLIVAVLFAVLLSFALSRQITRPVHLLTETAHELEVGNYDAQADINSADEVGTLAKTFNEMARQIKQTLAAIAQRAAELQTVSEVSASASTVLDTEKLLWNVANLTKKQFGLYHAHIYMMNEEGDTLVLAAGAGEAGQQMVSEGRKIALDNEKSLVARAARERKGVIVNDVRSAPDFLPHPLLPDTRAELAVPMIVGDKVLGVFDVQSDKANSFTQENADIQTIMATQIAVAVQNANLFAQAESNAQEARSLVDNAPEAIVVIDLVSGMFVEANENALKLYGMGREEILKVGPPQVSPSVQPDGRDSTQAAMEKIGEAMQTGTSVFDWTHRNAQGQDIPCEVRLVRMPGAHPKVRASVTDITARKQAQEIIAQRAQQLETVATISSASATILEQDKLLQTVVDLTKERFGLYHTHIYIMDETGTNLVLTSGAGEVGRKMVADGRSIPIDAEKSLVARAAREHKAVIVNDVQSDPDFLPNPLLPDTRSEMAVPLIIGEKVLGVLDVQGDVVDRFTQEDISIKNTLAAQIAISVQNARQYEETNDALMQSERLFNSSDRLARTTNLQALTAAAVEVLNIPAVNRALLAVFNYDANDNMEGMDVVANWWNGTGNEATAVGTHYSNEALRVLSIFTNPTPVFLNDTFTDERMDASALEIVKRQNIRAMVGLPLFLGSRQFGSLILEAEETHNFAQEDIRLFTALAPQIATILESRKQFEQAQSRARREAMLNEINQKIQSATTVESVLQIAARELGRAISAPFAVAQLGMAVKSNGNGNGNGNGRGH